MFQKFVSHICRIAQNDLQFVLYLARMTVDTWTSGGMGIVCPKRRVSRRTRWGPGGGGDHMAGQTVVSAR